MTNKNPPIIFNELQTPRGYSEVAIKPTFATFDEFSDISLIGEGHFGKTFKATWHVDKDDKNTWKSVALKISKRKPGKSEFSEAMILANLKPHQNVVPIYGLCNDFQEKPGESARTVAIVMPYYENGDLMSFLGSPEHNLTTLDVINIVIGMAKGLQHLHNNEIIHRDVRPENVLVSAERRVVVSDFGLSRSISDNYIYENTGGSQVPWRWCAPETIVQLEHSKYTDIWMLGVSLWQLVHREGPFGAYKTPAQLGIAFENGVKLKISDDCPSFIAEIIKQCTVHNSKNRIPLDRLIDTLVNEGNNLLNSVNILSDKHLSSYETEPQKGVNVVDAIVNNVDEQKKPLEDGRQKSKARPPTDFGAQSNDPAGYQLFAPGTGSELERKVRGTHQKAPIASGEDEKSKAINIPVISKASKIEPNENGCYALKLLIVGDSGVGKTCLFKRFAGEPYTVSFISSIGIDWKSRVLSIGTRRVDVLMFDTAGQIRFRGITVAYYRAAMGILLCYDITDRESFDNVISWAETLERHVSSRLRLTALIACKCDNEEKRVVTTTEGEDLAKRIGMTYFAETSAKTGDGVDAIYAQIVVFMVDSFAERPDESKGAIKFRHLAAAPEKKTCC